MADTQHLNWDDLKYFLALARSGTLRGGAKSIDANHATVARRLQVMEQSVGGRLFDRTPTGLILTHLGEELLPHAERVEDEMTTALRRIMGRDTQPRGVVSISMPHGIAMTSIMDDLTAFSESYPEIELDISFTNVIVDLARLEADVSLRVAYEVTQDVVGRKLVQMSSAAYCSPGYARRMKDNGGEGLNFLGFMEPPGTKTAAWVTQSCYPKATLRHRVAEVVPQITLAAAGLGLAQLSCSLGDRHPDLVRAPFQHPIPYRALWLLLHRDLRKTARVRLFVDFLAERIRARRDEFWVPGTKEL